MSRLKQYAHTLLSSYVQLGANIVFTLASVPIALHYLTKEEFGLWALSTQLAGYFNLLDMGMSGSVSRILIDHKDDPSKGSYGEVILTAFLVNVVQGVLVFVAGLGAVYALGPLLNVPPHLASEFQYLLFWQCGLLSISFVFRLGNLILFAHQRGDILNLLQAVAFLVQLGSLWLFFHLGGGLLSMIWAHALAQVGLLIIMTMVSCWSLGLFPTNAWGRPNWRRFGELFAFGRDMFLYQIGSQLVNASQTILISRLLGLDIGAVWSICTRTYTLLTQLVCRIFDMSIPPLAEMIVRGEKEKLLDRFKSLVVLTASLSVWAGTLFVYGNQAFVQWWTQGKIGWTPVNDLLLAVYLILAMLVRSHTGLAGLTKQFRFLRYVYLLEGIFFVTVAWLVLKPGGISAMLLVSICASLMFSFPYGIWRSAQFFETSWKAVAVDWIRPSLHLALLLAGPTFLLWYLSANLPLLIRLIAGAVILGAGGGALFLRFGLDKGLAREVGKRLPWVPSRLLVADEEHEEAGRR